MFLAIDAKKLDFFGKDKWPGKNDWLFTFYTHMHEYAS